VTSLRLIQVVTPLHIGEGAAVGAVDLPVARERHTGWPVIPATALKGALRERAGRRGHEPEQLIRVFGGEPGTATPSKGTVSFGDGVLVALAVRSLAGNFALLTSPLALGRLSRWHQGPTPPEPSIERAVCADPTVLRVRELDRVVFEDLPLLVDPADLTPWVEVLRGMMGEEAPLRHLAVVHDAVFSHAARVWLPIRTRSELDEDGVVKQGHLFTTEWVAPESLFAATLSGDGSDLLPASGEAFTIGGMRTIGSGRVAWFGGA
jgi:CRISPR-associated protein Cmr4